MIKHKIIPENVEKYLRICNVLQNGYVNQSDDNEIFNEFVEQLRQTYNKLKRENTFEQASIKAKTELFYMFFEVKK